jgi:hypothetical protein
MRLFKLVFLVLFMLLGKRLAPNDMKQGDLVMKWWIITDRRTGLIHGSAASHVDISDSLALPHTFGSQVQLTGLTEMHEPLSILYSQKYGG